MLEAELLPQRHDLSGALERVGKRIVVDCLASLACRSGGVEGEVAQGEGDEVPEFAV